MQLLRESLDPIERERADARAAFENGVRSRHAAIDRLRRTMLRTRGGPQREAMQAKIAALAAAGPAAEAAAAEFERACREREDVATMRATTDAKIRATPLFFARWHLNAHPAGTLRRP
ncbi:MAG: hypothetical protein ACKVS8_00695 [Phycisphaerales bacterium]